MKKILYIFFGFFGIILIMGLLGGWFLEKWGQALPENVQDVFLELKSISPEQFQESRESSSPTEKGYGEFITPDGKLKIAYPSNWLAIEDENTLMATVPEEWAEKYDFKTLFLAQQFEIEKFAQLIISQGDFDIQIEKIMDKMVEKNQEQDWEIEIIKSDIQEKEGTFEVEYRMPGGYSLYSKEKILLDEEKEGKTKAYLIALVALKKGWLELAERADFIVNSALLLDKNSK